MRPTGRPRKDAAPFDATLLLRTCERCGTVKEKPENEPWSRWQNRRYCSRDCWERRTQPTEEA